MKSAIVIIYGAAAAFALLCGLFYPSAVRLTYLVAATFVMYGSLSLAIVACSIADAGKIAAWCIHGLGSLITVALLAVYVWLRADAWFLAASALTGLVVVVTAILALALKPVR